MKDKNVNSKTRTKEQKEKCFYENKPVLDICYFLCEGLFLRKQMYILMFLFFGMKERESVEMIKSLVDYGLLKESQMEYSNTRLCYMSKFSTAMYQNKNSQDAKRITLNNKKIMESVFRTEFIITQLIPMMERQNIKLTVEECLNTCEQNIITLFTKANQKDVHQLYSELYEKMDDLKNSSDFINDYNIAICEFVLYTRNFLHQEIDYEIENVLELKNQRDKERIILSLSNDRNKYYYNLFNLISNGFFFRISPQNKIIKLGIFDTRNTEVNKLYTQLGYIYLMFERYFNSEIKLDIKVYLSTEERANYLRNKEKSTSFDFKKQQWKENNKRDTYLKQSGIREQYLENIHVTYVTLNLVQKYNIFQDI